MRASQTPMRLYLCSIILLVIFSYLVAASRAPKMVRTKATSPSNLPTNPFARSKPLNDGELLQFFREGHLRVDGLFNRGYIEDLLLPTVKTALKDKELEALQHQLKVVLGRDDADKLSKDQCKNILESSFIEPGSFPFLQLFQLWRSYEEAQRIACSLELGKMACQLLDVPAVRLYQDSLYVKRPGDGATLWHSDLNMAPFDTNDFVTCWIPLVPIPSTDEGGTGLSFASASHRDFALSYWYDPRNTELDGRYQIEDAEAFRVGDCSFHHGWCLHSAPPNESKQTSVSFVADQAPLLQKEGHFRRPEDEGAQSFAEWINEVGWGGFAEHPLLPLIYDEEFSDDEMQEIIQTSIQQARKK